MRVQQRRSPVLVSTAYRRSQPLVLWHTVCLWTRLGFVPGMCELQISPSHLLSPPRSNFNATRFDSHELTRKSPCRHA